MTAVSGRMLTDESWLAARIADLGASWRTDSMRVSATLWWCMTASALVEQVVRALAQRRPIPAPTLDRLMLTLRADGTVERVEIDAAGWHAAGADSGIETTEADIAVALRETLTTVIDRLTAVSGVRGPALWAVVTDVVGSWAVDAGQPSIGRRLAEAVGTALPEPRFVEVAGRTFVRRASCCLVYEAPGCEKCVSCPKRRPHEREALLADYTRQG
ncbi:(2Fe-2S)-binding protein [Nocardia zapadnayensis]|uniref:(2Fe-2S)-binding protein n=1 Tax=Nocardia rhamnosiphila TaxID=426716 RepID=UPI002247FD65|nr:(2Fe-2S)-binding protein [Nocardia zapadnayensis]MCX0272215.1 (2Fe-2S)-binding protein [Nocardia zapadnayensis]